LGILYNSMLIRYGDIGNAQFIREGKPIFYLT
jgi:hypothetical protein